MSRGGAAGAGGVKRAIDVVVSIVALVALAPVLLVVAVLVRLRLGRPVLFRQTRPGRDGEPFELIKFRTMTDERDASGSVRTDDQRLTPFGQRLRATSLDELPEVWNVLRGDMSLVGPRPLLVEYLPRYDARQARRHEVRPGLTGLAQVTGRNATSWAERLELDVRYVESQCLWLDLRILTRTLAAVLRRDGVRADGHVTMPRFEGRGPDRRDGDPVRPSEDGDQGGANGRGQR